MSKVRLAAEPKIKVATEYRCNKIVGKEPKYTGTPVNKLSTSQARFATNRYVAALDKYEARMDKCFKQYSKYYSNHPKAVANILQEKAKVDARIMKRDELRAAKHPGYNY